MGNSVTPADTAVKIEGTISIVFDDGRSALVDVTSPLGKFRSATLTAQTEGRSALLRADGFLKVGSRIVGKAIEGLEMWELIAVEPR